MTAQVGIARVADYDRAAVLDGLRACLAPLGGLAAFVRPGQKVLLKPNFLGPFAPERATTTHPEVIRAAAVLVREAGAEPWLGDSPGLGDFKTFLGRLGLREIIAELDIRLADFSDTVELEDRANVVARRIALARAVRDTDVLITLPKLKTHSQMTFTGALKNQFGLIPGTRKAHYHYRFRDRDWLAALMIDINRLARPALGIMDAIDGMEGAGPSGGEPRRIGALLASSDLAALDVIACRIINLPPERVPLLRAARKHGFGTVDPDQIATVGARWEDFHLPDYKQAGDPTDILRIVGLPAPVLEWLRRQWAPRPRIRPALCIGCGACRQGCPVTPAAIDPQAKPQPLVDDARCIRCYCCHEFCPVKAIDLQRTLVGRLLLRGRGNH